jgi:autotransporter adhesin
MSDAVLAADGSYLFNLVEIFDWAFDETGKVVFNATDRYATGYASVAMGVGNHVSGYQSVGIGSYNVVGGKNSVSLGVKNWSNGDESVVLGSGNVLTGEQSIAIGTNNSVSGAQSIAIGVGHTITGNNSGAFGDPVTITGSGSYGVGNNISIESNDSFVMGSDVTIAQDHHKAVALGAGTAVNVEGGVALGAGSVANRAAGTSGYIPAGATASQQAAIEATTSTLAGVSVGDADNGHFRQIHGVAAGTDDSDAVNVSQLKGVQFETNTKLSAIGDQVEINTTNIANLQVDVNSSIDLLHQDSETSEIRLGSKTDGDTVSISGLDGDRRITGVAPGVLENDAATVGQVANVASSLNQRVDSLQRDVSRVDKNASGGTAAAMAMANLPQAWRPSQTGLAAGVSNYRGHQGYALGVSHMSDNSKWVLKGSVAGSNRGSVGVAAGVFYSFD